MGRPDLAHEPGEHAGQERAQLDRKFCSVPPLGSLLAGGQGAVHAGQLCQQALSLCSAHLQCGRLPTLTRHIVGLAQYTAIFESTDKLLAKRMIKYCNISMCSPPNGRSIPGRRWSQERQGRKEAGRKWPMKVPDAALHRMKLSSAGTTLVATTLMYIVDAVRCSLATLS